MVVDDGGGKGALKSGNGNIRGSIRDGNGCCCIIGFKREGTNGNGAADMLGLLKNGCWGCCCCKGKGKAENMFVSGNKTRVHDRIGLLGR